MQVFRRVGTVAVRLLLVPGIVEALVAGGVAHGIFNMPILLAFTLGFILKAVGPVRLMLSAGLSAAHTSWLLTRILCAGHRDPAHV